MIETYKILTGKHDPPVSNFLPLHREVRPGSATRGNILKLFKKHTTHQRCANSFCYRVTDKWNSLPDTVVSAPSTTSFENRLDKHWDNLIVKYDFETAISSDNLLATTDQ